MTEIRTSSFKDFTAAVATAWSTGADVVIVIKPEESDIYMAMVEDLVAENTQAGQSG